MKGQKEIRTDQKRFDLPVFCPVNSIIENYTISSLDLWDHPFKTSACLRGGRAKKLPNLLTDSTKKLPTVRGVDSVDLYLM